MKAYAGALPPIRPATIRRTTTRSASDSTPTIEKYETDMSEPAEVFKDPQRISTYIEPLGNISYVEKQNYWKEPFTP